MKNIQNFPYGELHPNKNPMHKRLLLLEETKRTPLYNRSFMIGYYDSVHDLFRVWPSGYQHSDTYRYEEQSIEGFPGMRCILPDNLAVSYGSRCFTSYALLGELVERACAKNLFDMDIDKLLKEGELMEQYLLCIRDQRMERAVIPSSIDNYCETGRSFAACVPTMINGQLCHIKSTVPRSEIFSAVKAADLAGLIND